MHPFNCMQYVQHYNLQTEGLQHASLQSIRKELTENGTLSFFVQNAEVCSSLFSSIHRLLFLKLKAQNEKERFAFCSVKGCERIRIKAVIPKHAGVSDCEAMAYPKYIETPIVEVPMPKKLSSTQLVK